MGLLAVAVAAAGARLWEEVAILRAAPRDNSRWSTAQLEVDVLRLQLAIESVRTGDATLDHVRRWYDLLYSRIKTISTGDVFASFRKSPDVEPLVERLESFLAKTTPVIDGSDQQLAAAMVEFRVQLDEISETSRNLALNAVYFFAERSDAERRQFADGLTAAMAASLALIVLLGVSLLYIDAQHRLAARRVLDVERSRRRLAATTNASLDGIVVMNADGVVIDWNKAAEEIFGRSGEEAVGREMAGMIVPKRYLEAHRKGMTRFLTTGEKRVVDAGRVELSALRADGGEFPVELTIASAESGEGPIFISYLRDISKRLADEKALTEARDAAMTADRAKSEFLAVMSHEMRTPLNGVLGLLDLLQNTKLDERQKEYVETATVSGEVLLNHINDVLDITRIEAGKVRFEQEPVDLGPLIDEVLEIAGPVASANGNRVETAVDAGIGVLSGDPHRLRQVLINLIGNAAKFTRNGRITVGATATPAPDGGVEVKISVTDTGPGIAPEDRERIFEDFVTLDSSYDRAHSGTGLGLAISRRIVRGMGGEIGVADGPVGGSRFWVRLPMQRAQAVPAQAEPTESRPQAITPRKVLVVEDNDVNRLVLREMLANAGHSVREARNGREGVEAALGEHFDLILMDVSMPEVDGVEATRRIRASEGPCRETPIIGLTAHAMPEEQKRFVSEGMQLCLTKPVRRQELLGQIAQWTDGANELGDEAEAPAGAETPLIDTDVLGDLALSLPAELLRSMVAKAAAEFAGATEGLRAETDPAELERRVHKLSGGAAVLGAARLHARYREIESAAKSGRLEDARALLAGLDPLVAETVTLLEEAVSG